jgi:hypothetical protein
MRHPSKKKREAQFKEIQRQLGSGESRRIDWDAITSPEALALELFQIQNSSAVDQLSPNRFQELFDRVYGSTKKFVALWRLGSAAHSYLSLHPGFIRLPEELPRKLLKSVHVDARVVGLKLLKHVNPSTAETISEIARAIETCDGYESFGGVYQLQEWLDQQDQNVEPLEHSEIIKLARALKLHIKQVASDRYGFARSVMNRLDRLKEASHSSSGNFGLNN